MSDGIPASGGSELITRAAQLRAEFDRIFSEPRPPEPPPTEELLVIRLGTEPFALRLSEIAGLFADRKLTPLPGSVPALLGLAGFRGTIAPVYDLRVLLGHRSGEAARWLVMAKKAALGFAFGTQDGHLRVPHDMIIPEPEERTRKHVRECARTAEHLLPIVQLSSVIEAIRQQVPAKLGPKGE
jgi:purine-binding chemotaxis protein CheW